MELWNPNGFSLRIPLVCALSTATKLTNAIARKTTLVANNAAQHNAQSLIYIKNIIIIMIIIIIIIIIIILFYSGL